MKGHCRRFLFSIPCTVPAAGVTYAELLDFMLEKQNKNLIILEIIEFKNIKEINNSI